MLGSRHTSGRLAICIVLPFFRQVSAKNGMFTRKHQITVLQFRFMYKLVLTDCDTRLCLVNVSESVVSSGSGNLILVNLLSRQGQLI
jgi:hypothetical protein